MPLFKTCGFVLLSLFASLPVPKVVAGEAQAGNRLETDLRIARWSGGEVRQSEYLTWLRHRKLADDPAIRQAEIEQMLLTRQLAAAAIQRGTDGELGVVLRDIEERRWQRVWRQSFDASVEVSAAEIDKLAKANATAFDQPRKVRLRNIFLRFPEGADEAQRLAVRKSMAGLRKALAEGADFADLARRYSDSESRYRGGLMSVVSAGELGPELARVVMALIPGQVSEALVTADGLTLLRCEKVHAEVTLSPAEVRQRIEINLRRLRVEEHWLAERERWLEAAQPVYDLESGQDPDARRDALVLRFAGALPAEAKEQGELSVGDLEVLLSQQAGRSRTGRHPETLRELLEEKTVTFMAWRRAGLDGLVTEQSEVASQILWRQHAVLASTEIARRVRGQFQPPGEDDVKAFFEARREKFRRLPHYELDLIWLEVSPEDPRPAFRLAESLVQRIRDREITFAAAARKFSQHPSASEGGHLGKISRRAVAQFGPDPYHAVVALAPGEVGTPVRLDGKLWIFHLGAFEEQRLLQFEEARPRAEKMLAEQRLEDLQLKILAELRAGLDVRLDIS